MKETTASNGNNGHALKGMIAKTCIICGKNFHVGQFASRANACSEECRFARHKQTLDAAHKRERTARRRAKRAAAQAKMASAPTVSALPPPAPIAALSISPVVALLESPKRITALESRVLVLEAQLETLVTALGGLT